MSVFFIGANIAVWLMISPLGSDFCVVKAEAVFGSKIFRKKITINEDEVAGSHSDVYFK